MSLIALVAAILLTACSPAGPAPGTLTIAPRAEDPPDPSAPAGSEPHTVASSPGPSQTAARATIDTACPITRPNGVPPPEGEASGGNYFGNGRLWTVLWPKGMVVVPPDAVEPDGGLGMKFPWWRAPDVHGALHITGHELRLQVPVRADVPNGYGDTGFQASGIVFPLEGWYQITGEAGGAQITFITMVRSCSAIAEMPPAERKLYSICDR
jgi:hypothetical protein